MRVLGKGPKLSRRAVLRGLGAAVALPTLEAMRPLPARAQAQAARRLFFFYVPNGMHMPSWTPSAVGTGFDLPPILAPLASHQSELLVLSGLSNHAADPQGDGPGDHARGTGCFLTCAHPNKTEGADIYIGPSVDQVAAQGLADLGVETRFGSLELGCEGGGSTGNCDSGYSCAYSRNIAWSSATTPVPKEVNPRSAFDRLFAGADPADTAEQIARRKRYKLSILDFVKEDAMALQSRLGARDRQKLEEYLDGVRDTEQRVETLDTAPACEPFARPEGIPSDVTDYVRVMLDIGAIALECDLTRVVTFMLGNGGSNRSYPNLGVASAHHEISHHQMDPVRQAQLETIDIWEVEQLAYLLDRLSLDDGTGTSLLDESLVLFSSEIADGDSHAHSGLPVLLAGRGGGAASPGRHVMYDDAPIADLFLSMLTSVGVTPSSFGDDGTGPLSGLIE